MTLTELRFMLGLPSKYMRMIEKVIKDNCIGEIDSFAIVSRNLLFEEDFQPDDLRIAWFQDYQLVEVSKIKKDDFFFQLVDGYAYGKAIIVPTPPTSEKQT